TPPKSRAALVARLELRVLPSEPSAAPEFRAGSEHRKDEEMCARNGTTGLRWFVVLLAVAGLAAAAATQANASPVARLDANTPTTFTDPTGDSGTAPDISSVVVSNDATRTITFRINVDKLVVPSDVRFLI